MRPRRPRYLLATFLLAATFLSTTTLGAVWFVMSRTDMTIELALPLPLLTAGLVRKVWTDPELLRLGLQFSLPALFILLCHELGHYLACRRYRVPATLPYFLPAPFGLGTLGAFIRIRAPIRGKRELFDIGIAGPIAGFVALLPFLLYGVARSAPASIHEATGVDAGTMVLIVPGR